MNAAASGLHARNNCCRAREGGIGSGRGVFVARVPVRWLRGGERVAVRGDGCFVFGELELDDGIRRVRRMRYIQPIEHLYSVIASEYSF